MNNQHLVSVQQELESSSGQLDEDVIELIDIIRFLSKNRLLILAVAVLFTGLGVIYALMKPEEYAYNTAIHIGSIEQKKILDPATLTANIQNYEIPLALDNFYRKNPEEKRRLNIAVKNPKGSDIIFLEAKSTENDAAVYVALINTVAKQVVDDLNQKTLAAKTTLIERLANAEKQKAAVEMSLVEARRLLGNIDSALSTASGEKVLATANLFEQTQVLEKTGYEIAASIVSLKASLAELQETRLGFPVSRSVRPTGLDSKLIILLSVIAGLFFGLVMAFFFELSKSVKAKF